MLFRAPMALTTLCVVGAAPIQAQNTSGVFSPDVKAGDKTVQYRLSYIPEEDGRDSRSTHRIHYQQALNDEHRFRVILSGSDRETGSLETTYLRGEWQWQVTDKARDGFNGAFRFDLRLQEGDDSASRFGVNWTSQFDLSDKWYIRLLATTSTDFGDRARDGVFLGARSGIFRKLEDGYTLGVHHFSSFGSTESFGSFNDNNHQAGPYLRKKFDQGWSLEGRALFGLSDRANDTDIGIWVTRSF